ncbi:MAG: class II aldolase/adducin family protein [Pseudomonadota bacterium]
MSGTVEHVENPAGPEPEEGTIQFGFELLPFALGEVETLAADPILPSLRAWRGILRDLALIGQTPELYAGFAYGNLSFRRADDFVVTASQTSGAADLVLDDLVVVGQASTERFWVDARGIAPPSSESITHAMLYAADHRIRCVLHVHNPVIWGNRTELQLLETGADVGYGTPAMASAVAQLLDGHQTRPLIFATAGHEDGIFVCGRTPQDCGTLLVQVLAKARALDGPPPARAEVGEYDAQSVTR